VELGGAQLLNKYNNSPSLLLAKIFPDYEWLPWKFLNTPKHFWSVKKNQIQFLDWAGKRLGIRDFTDWNKISTKVSSELSYNFLTFQDIIELGGRTLLDNFSLSEILSLVNPQVEISQQSSPFYKKTQETIKAMLKTMFPQDGKISPFFVNFFVEVLQEYRHPDLKSTSGFPLELDFFFPKYNLAIEYQVLISCFFLTKRVNNITEILPSFINRAQSMKTGSVTFKRAFNAEKKVNKCFSLLF
jgi:hypothetical protein